jgi:large subunit ribosomal protein L20
MTRVKRGIVTKKRHKRLLNRTKGYWGSRSNLFKRAKETLLRAMAYAFRGRKLKKRSMRALFIVRVSAAAGKHGLKYNAFIHKLKMAHVQLNRKMLSQIAIFDSAAFEAVVNVVK